MHDQKTIQRFRDAQELYRQERWAEALRVFDDLSLSYKSDPEIMLNRAMCLARLGNEEEAELLCDHITIVHKDPRGAQLRAEIPLWRREGKAAPEEKKARKPILSPEALKRGIVACFVLAVCMTAWSFYSAYKAPIPPSIATMPAPGERVLRFPENASVGTLVMRDWRFATDPLGRAASAWQSLGEARGRVTVPAGKEVQLTIAPGQIAQLPALRRLGPNDIQALNMNRCAIQDADLSHIAHLTGLFVLSIDDTPIGPEGYRMLRRLTSLRDVSIIDTELGETGREFIGRQQYLTGIDADRADLTDAWLIDLPPLENLTFLSLDDTPGITDEGIRHIAKHQNLEHLFLSYTGLTDASMKSLQSLKSLKRAWFEGTKITDASMAGFRLMPGIEEIGIAYTEVTTEGFLELAGIRTLKKVGIKGCDNISVEGIRRFKAQLPDCEVETNLNV